MNDDGGAKVPVPIHHDFFASEHYIRSGTDLGIALLTESGNEILRASAWVNGSLVVQMTLD